MARCLALAILIAHAANAHADATVRLVTVGQGCSVETLPSRVTTMLGRDPFDARSRVVVRVEVEDVGEHVAASVTFEDGDGRRGPRRIDAADCDALLDSIALVITMGVTVESDRTGVSTTSTAPSLAAPAPALEVRATHTVAQEPDSTELAVSVGGAAGFSTSGWQPQLTLGLDARTTDYAFAVEVRRTAPERRAIAATGSLDIRTTTASGVACRRVGNLELCGAISAGMVQGAGTGLFEARRVTSPVMGLGARVGLEHAVWRPVRARVELGGDGLLTTSRFDVDHMPVWTSSTFQVWAGVGVLARFL